MHKNSLISLTVAEEVIPSELYHITIITAHSPDEAAGNWQRPTPATYTDDEQSPSSSKNLAPKQRCHPWRRSLPVCGLCLCVCVCVCVCVFLSLSRQLTAYMQYGLRAWPSSIHQSFLPSMANSLDVC
ncbi:hypothetical protein M758_4G001900 [Ceratodon purpureus]|nr:hypothetical protein M758_4G001900 [Ceratodon purpureus]